MSSEARKKILFLCTGNACRSQMAEGWLRALHPGRFDAYSAGIEKHGLNPNAVKVMAEAGVDISQQYSKHLDELADVQLDEVVAVCDHAQQHCPVLDANTKMTGMPFDDPPKLALGLTDEEAVLDCYRKVRDDIKQFVEQMA